jgi:hypothetical protein
MSEDMAKLVRELAGVDRRIDNMRYLIEFQQERRDKVVGRMRAALGRAAVRTTAVDSGAGREPGTDHRCIMCQQDLDPDGPAGVVRLMRTADDGAHAVHVEDIGLLDIGVLDRPTGAQDGGDVPIGLDCAGRLGEGWWRPGGPKE